LGVGQLTDILVITGSHSFIATGNIQICLKISSRALENSLKHGEEQRENEENNCDQAITKNKKGKGKR
jgi:hypothetical protein